MFVAAFSGKVTILSPNLDPKARVLHVTFRLFFRPGTKRGPRGDQEVPKATKKRPWGSPGVPKREPRRCPGYPKRVLGDLFTARWRGGRRQVDPPRHAESMGLGVLNHLHNPPKSGSEENPYPSLAAAGPPREYHGSSKFAPRITLRKNDRNCCKNEPNRPPKRAPKIIKIMQNVV
jgi:hypothetical protein